MEGVVQIKDITLVWASTATVTSVISTDLPGGTLTSRATPSFASTGSTAQSARKEDTIALDGRGPIEGKLVQVKFACAAGLAVLYSGSLRVRKIGCYLNGANNDIFETQPMALGS